MKVHTGLIAAVLGALAIVAAARPALADSLRISGTGLVTEALRALAPGFAAKTGISLDIVADLGTTGASNAILDGKLDLAIGGRDLRDKEKAQGLQVLMVLRTPFGFVTSRPGPDNLDKQDILRLFQAANPTWPDGMPVLIALRPAGEIDNQILATLFPGMGDVLAQLRRRRDLSIAATNHDNADLAEKTKGSLVAATLTQIKAERRNLRFVAIDHVEPSLVAYLDGSYPYGKLLYVVVPAAPSAKARHFVQFLASPETRPQLDELALAVGVR
jgi:phosphate transport system substrate-binding protein